MRSEAILAATTLVAVALLAGCAGQSGGAAPAPSPALVPTPSAALGPSGCFDLAAVPSEEMLVEVADAVHVLDGLDVDATRWFRFPGGCYDREALRRTAPAGVTAVDVDVYGGGDRSEQSTVDSVLGGVRPGAIVTLDLHGGGARNTAASPPNP